MYNKHSYGEVCPPLILILLYLHKNSSSWENRPALNKAENVKHLIPFVVERKKCVLCQEGEGKGSAPPWAKERASSYILLRKEKKIICSTAEIKYFTVSLWATFMKIHRLKVGSFTYQYEWKHGINKDKSIS